MRFWQTLRTIGLWPWQRLQGVRAVAMYRNSVWKTDQPELHHIRSTLSRIADRDRANGTHSCGAKGDHRELAFLDVTAANKPARLPVVLSLGELALFLPEFSGMKRLMFLTMDGAGRRHAECR